MVDGRSGVGAHRVDGEQAPGLPPVAPAADVSAWLVASPSAEPVAETREAARFYGAHGGAGATILADVLGEEDGGLWAGIPPEDGTAVLVGRTHAHGLDAIRKVLASAADDVFSAVMLVPDAPGRLPRELRDQVHIIGGVLPVLRVPWVEEWRRGKTDPQPSAVTKFVDEYRKTVR